MAGPARGGREWGQGAVLCRLGEGVEVEERARERERERERESRGGRASMVTAVAVGERGALGSLEQQEGDIQHHIATLACARGGTPHSKYSNDIPE